MGIPFKDKQVGLIVERHNLGTKNLSPYYIEPPRVLPSVGWGALDGGEGEEEEGGRVCNYRPSSHENAD